MKIASKDDFAAQVAQLCARTDEMHANSLRAWEASGGHKRQRVFGESLIAICTEDDANSELTPISKTYGLSIINRVHGNGAVEGMVACSPFAQVDSRVYCGTADLRVHEDDRTRFGLATANLEPIEKWKLAGNLRNNKARADVTMNANIAFRYDRRWDHRLLKWSLWAFEQCEQKVRQAGAFISPSILSPVPDNGVEWLQLRRGAELDERLLAIVNHKFYEVDGVFNAASDDSRAEYDDTPDGQFVIHPHTGAENPYVLFNPGQAFRDAISKTFGVPCALKFYALNRAERVVTDRESMFTPIQEQAADPAKVWTLEELKALPQYNDLLYLAAMSSFQFFDNLPYVNSNLAYSRQEPFVHLPASFPRIQRVDGKKESFLVEESGLSMDLLNVPHRVSVREAEKIKAQAAVKVDPALEFLTPVERMMYVITPPTGRKIEELFRVVKQRSTYQRDQMDKALTKLTEKGLIKLTGESYFKVLPLNPAVALVAGQV